MQAKAFTASGLVMTGKGEFHGVNIHNDDAAVSDIALDDSVDGSGDVKWKERIAADVSDTQMLNDGKGRGITFSDGCYLTISNDTSITVVVYFT